MKQKKSHKSDCKCASCEVKRGNNPMQVAEFREKVRQSKLGDKNPMKRPEVVNKMINTSRERGVYKKSSELLKERWRNGLMLSHKMTDDEKRVHSERTKLNNPMKNSETTKKASVSIKKSIRDENYIPFFSTDEGKLIVSGAARNRMLTDNPMKDPEIAKKVHEKTLKSDHAKNKTEIFVDEILQHHYPQKWKYVGDGGVFIGGKVPDWISNDDSRIVIEYASTYWHQTVVNKSMDVYVNERNKHFAKYDFRVIFIFDDDLTEDKILKKINNFIHNHDEMD